MSENEDQYVIIYKKEVKAKGRAKVPENAPSWYRVVDSTGDFVVVDRDYAEICTATKDHPNGRFASSYLDLTVLPYNEFIAIPTYLVGEILGWTV